MANIGPKEAQRAAFRVARAERDEELRRQAARDLKSGIRAFAMPEEAERDKVTRPRKKHAIKRKGAKRRKAKR